MGAFIDRALETFELMANVIMELQKRVEALEHRSPLTEVLPEVDRSHAVSVGESHYHL
jgi:hypothetical protein